MSFLENRTTPVDGEFGKCEPSAMDLKTFRLSQGWTLEQAARELGLKSKGYVHDLEKQGAASTPVALKLWRDFGVKVRPIAHMSDEEVAVLQKFGADRAA